jgi:hypothetical protein
MLEIFEFCSVDLSVRANRRGFNGRHRSPLLFTRYRRFITLSVCLAQVHSKTNISILFKPSLWEKQDF